MKRFLFGLLAALALLTASHPAEAGRWISNEVQWVLTGQICSGSSTSICQRDTFFAALGATDDTTGWFNLKDADPPLLVNGAASDTLVIAYLVLVNDTTVTFTQSTTNMTVAFQVASKTATTTVLNGTTAASAISVMTSGDRCAVFPIAIVQRGHSGNATDMLAVGALGELNVRGITTTVIGGGFPMARAFVVYYDADE